MTTCGGNRFGLNCELQCSFKTDIEAQCKSTQICLSNPYGCECLAGYTGLECLTDCSFGKFGAGCSQECHCNPGGCNQYTGVCTSAGCAAGWSGTNCQVPEVCPVGYFGGDCTSICHCKDNVACDKADGTCSNGECAEGYHTYSNAYCEECESGTYGNMCELTCNCDSNSCHHDTGCDGGCIEYWLPNSCTTGIVSTSNVKVNPGQTTTFQCTVLGDITDVNITLQADSESVAETERVQSTTNTTVSFSTVANTGIVYIFSISKDFFIKPRAHTVDLFSLPAYTGEPSVTSVTGSSVELSWREWDQEQGDSGDGPIVGYIVYYYYDSTWSEIPQVSQPSATVTGLDYEQGYSFVVAAVREGGGGKGSLGSQSISARTLCGEPSPPDVSTIRSLEKPKQIEMSWKPLTIDEAKCSTGIVSYTVSYRPSDESLSTNLTTETLAYTLQDLETYTEYTISVMATNKDFVGVPTITIEYSPEEKPPAPEVKATHKQSYLVVSVWLSPSVTRNLYGNMIQYDVRYSSDDEWGIQQIILNEGEDNIEGYRIPNLDTGNYQVSARVVNGAGVGNWSFSTTAVKAPVNDRPKSGSNSVIVGAVIGILFILFIAAILIFCIIRIRKRSSKKEDTYMQYARKRNDSKNDISENSQSYECLRKPIEDSMYEAIELEARNLSFIPEVSENFDERLYENVKTMQPICINDLPDFVAKKRLNLLDGLLKEYGTLPKGQTHPWEVASQPSNSSKNRFKNIFAYDHSRVTLEGNGTESGYINACYVHGYKRNNVYIASQGPNKVSLTDFWRMIWQENIENIVMLSNIESDKKVCEKYWQDNMGPVAEYGEFNVLLDAIEGYADHKIRYLKVWKDEVDYRCIKQFHFTTWPDMGVPPSANAVLRFIKEVKCSATDAPAPLLVHCSAGVGSTGTFIAINSMMEMVNKEQKVDVYNYVRKLRDQRINMVYTPDQYVFIYDVLLEYSFCEDTAMNASNFQERHSELKRINPQTNTSYLNKEFEILQLVTPHPAMDHCKTALLPENENKNRFSDVVPIDRYRPYLLTQSSTGGNAYINASFVNGYKKNNKFIATQMPLPNTVEDMWRLLFDWNVRSVVMLNEMDLNDPSYAKYWMDEEGATEQYGHLVVTLTSNQSKGAITIREFSITNNYKPDDMSTVSMYQVHGWPTSQDIPENPINLLEVLELVDKNQHEYHHGSHPIAVHCSNGVGRTGIFCTIIEIVESMKLENIIDVFQTVKKMRTKRPGLVQNIDQYSFCYEIISAYIGHCHLYENPTVYKK
ncbi:uncharacterized protein [Antedon mediterranea]|uniref:uncharacterized protein n=1 Tax=Antedon mediterranea TaxID=105859 RepID=UPI003AF51558